MGISSVLPPPPQDLKAVLTGHSSAGDAHNAVAELRDAVLRDDTALVVFFCSPAHDIDAISEEIRSQFRGVIVVGCTSAGEIGALGYTNGALAGMSFSSREFEVAVSFIDELDRFEISRGEALGKALWAELHRKAPAADRSNTFGILLIDGLSIREEQVTRALQGGLGQVPLIGGSAGDDLAFQRTRVFHDGEFHSAAAVCILTTTRLPFRVFKTQHFVAMSERLVVTGADSTRRIVSEINGRPAAQEYARALHCGGMGLDPFHFAASPVVVMIDGTNYVRSIQRANADGSLTFYCAIEEGLVLRAAKGVDLAGNLSQAMDAIVEAVGPPQAILAFECILRKLEIVAQASLRQEITDLLRSRNVLGFNTYGEQYQGVHVNQTLVGLAFGERST